MRLTTVLLRWNGRAVIVLASVVLAGCARFEPRPLAPGQTAADLEQRSLANPALRFFLEKSLGRALPDWPPAEWDEQMLTLVAFYFHPSLDVARAQWGVARAGVKTAEARPNPVLSLTPGGSLNPIGASPWEPTGSLDIPFETAGKRGYRIAQALGLPLKGVEGAEFRFPLAVAADAASDLTSAQVRRQALLGRSDILSALAEYAASQSALQLEIAKQYPDVHLNPGYMFDEGEHKWTLGLSMELPVRNRNQGPIAEAKAKREEAAARFVALQARVIAQIDGALAARAAALDQLRRQGRLTQLALEQSAAADALFKAGAADRLELASAQLEAGASNLVFLEAQIKARQALAQLEDAIQRPLQLWPSLEDGRAPQAHSDGNGNRHAKQ